MPTPRRSHDKLTQCTLLRTLLLAWSLGLCAFGFCAPAVGQTRENARDYYIKAGAALDRTVRSADPQFDGGSAAPDKVTPFKTPLERNEAVLKANAKALALLRQGFAFQYRKLPDPNVVAGMSFNGQMRQAARVLMLESRVRAAKGDWAGAVESGLDAMRLGIDIAHGPLIDMLVGNAIEAIGRNSMRMALDHLDRPTARSAARRLEEIMSGQLSYAEIMRVEKTITLAMLPMHSDDPAWKQSTAFAEAERALAQVLDDVIANADLPYPDRKTLLDLPANPIAQEFMTNYTDPQMESLGFMKGASHARNQSQDAMLLAALALRAFQVEHNNYPESLNELVPVYLNRVPADPFARGDTIRYRKNGNSYMLYSIGPDSKDDGGKPIEHLDAPTGSYRRHAVDAQSTGDIVAGINP